MALGSKIAIRVPAITFTIQTAGWRIGRKEKKKTRKPPFKAVVMWLYLAARESRRRECLTSESYILCDFGFFVTVSVFFFIRV